MLKLGPSTKKLKNTAPTTKKPSSLLADALKIPSPSENPKVLLPFLNAKSPPFKPLPQKKEKAIKKEPFPNQVDLSMGKEDPVKIVNVEVKKLNDKEERDKTFLEMIDSFEEETEKRERERLKNLLKLDKINKLSSTHPLRKEGDSEPEAAGHPSSPSPSNNKDLNVHAVDSFYFQYITQF
jgi:hypothetical protein